MKIIDIFIEFKDTDTLESEIKVDGISLGKKIHKLSSNLENYIKKASYGNEEALKFVGEEMAFILFPDKKYILQELNNLTEDKKLVFKINSEDSKVHELPFESVYFNEEFLIKKPRVYMVRDIPSVSEMKYRFKKSKNKIKILVIISMPFDVYENAPLDLLNEIKIVYNELDEEIKKGNIELYIEEKANINNIRKILENESFDIVHFSGHGAKGGYLVMEDENNPKKEKLISITDFYNLFNVNEPSLIFFDSCKGAKGIEGFYYQPSIAFEIYKRFKKTHVIANVESVLDNEAIDGAKNLYKALKDKKPLAQLLKENRNALHNDWWKSVIFTSMPDSILFDYEDKKEILFNKILEVDNLDDIQNEYVYRYKIIREASKKLENKNYLALYGIGGSGKSYLMKYFSWFYQGRFENIIYIDLRDKNIDTLKKFYEYLLDIFFSYEKIDEKEYEELLDILENKNIKISKIYLNKKIKEILKEKSLLILDNLEEIAQKDDGVLKDEWREFIDFLIKEKIFLFMASRLKIKKTQREEFDNYILIEDFERFEVELFLRKNRDSFEWFEKKRSEIEYFFGYHPLSLKLLLRNRPDDIKRILKMQELKDVLEFYRKYFEKYEYDSKIVFNLLPEFDRKILEILDVKEDFINICMNELFVLNYEGKFKINIVIRSYFKDKFKLTRDEALKIKNKVSYLTNDINSNFLLLKAANILKDEELDGYFSTEILFRKIHNHDIYEEFVKLESFYNEIKNKTPKIYNNMANALARLGKIEIDKEKSKEYYKEAIKNYQKTIELNPNFEEAYINIASALASLGEIDKEKSKDYYEKAIKHCQKAIELNPNFEEAYINMASAYQRLGEIEIDKEKSKEYYEKAIKHCQKAIELNLNFTEAYINLANALARLGEIEIDKEKSKEYYQKAIKHYQKAIELNPNDEKTYYNIAIVYKSLGEIEIDKEKSKEYYQKAIKHYQKAIELKPNYEKAYNNMAIVYQRLGEIDKEKSKEYYQKAIKHCQKAIELNPNDEKAYNNLANVLQRLGEIEIDKEKSKEYYEEAIKNYQKAIDLNPNIVEAYINIASALASLGEIDKEKSKEYYQKAIKHCQKAIELNPNFENAYNNLANALANLGDIEIDKEKSKEYYQKAIKHYQKAINLDKNYVYAYNNLANALARLGEIDKEKSKEYYEEAIKNYQKAIDLNPNIAQLYNNLANAYQGLGKIEIDKEKSKEYYEEAIKNYQKYMKLINSAYDFVKVYPFYIYSYLKTDFDEDKFYEEICNFYEYYYFVKEERYLLRFLENIIKVGIELKKDKKFKNQRCEEFYKNSLYPLFEMMKSDNRLDI